MGPPETEEQALLRRRAVRPGLRAAGTRRGGGPSGGRACLSSINQLGIDFAGPLWGDRFSRHGYNQTSRGDHLRDFLFCNRNREVSVGDGVA